MVTVMVISGVGVRVGDRVGVGVRTKMVRVMVMARVGLLPDFDTWAVARRPASKA